MAIHIHSLLFNNIITHHEEIGCKYFHFKIKIVLHTISNRYTTFWFPSFVLAFLFCFTTFSNTSFAVRICFAVFVLPQYVFFYRFFYWMIIHGFNKIFLFFLCKLDGSTYPSCTIRVFNHVTCILPPLWMCCTAMKRWMHCF